MKKIDTERGMNKKQCASLIDHTCLRANARKKDIEQLCHEAIKYGFRAVCINQTWVLLCAKLLKKHPHILVACVVDFPLGAGDIGQKKALAILAKNAGATELDVVMNIAKEKKLFLIEQISTMVFKSGLEKDILHVAEEQVEYKRIKQEETEKLKNAKSKKLK